MIVSVLGVKRGKASVIGADFQLPKNRKKLQEEFHMCLKQWATDEIEDGDEEPFLEQVASKMLGDEDWKGQEPEVGKLFVSL